MDKKNKKEKPKKEERTREEKSSEEDSLEQIVGQNKQLKLLFIAIGVLLILFFSAYMIVGSLSKFNYEGLKFKIVKFCDIKPCLMTYNIAFPYKNAMTGKVTGDYNFYIRNDPRKLKEEVEFDGVINLKKNIVMNSEDAFNCDGDGIIAIENMRKMLEVMGAKIMRDDNATCDESGRYTYILLRPENKTSIEQYAPSCYNININNCEILKATERFMVETFVKFNEQENPSLVISFSEVD